MNDSLALIHWASETLSSLGYAQPLSSEIIVETPWSTVMCFKNAKEAFYLKQTPPLLFIEAQITPLLAQQGKVQVPCLLASNDNLKKPNYSVCKLSA